MGATKAERQKAHQKEGNERSDNPFGDAFGGKVLLSKQRKWVLGGAC
jgi:hypothetical protein